MLTSLQIFTDKVCSDLFEKWYNGIYCSSYWFIHVSIIIQKMIERGMRDAVSEPTNAYAACWIYLLTEWITNLAVNFWKSITFPSPVLQSNTQESSSHNLDRTQKSFLKYFICSQSIFNLEVWFVIWYPWTVIF